LNEQTNTVSEIYVWQCKKCNLEQSTIELKATLVCKKCKTLHCNVTYCDAMVKLYEQQMMNDLLALAHQEGELYGH
jgi:hypothetical protein